MTTRPHILRAPQVRAALDKRLSAVIVPLREQPRGTPQYAYKGDTWFDDWSTKFGPDEYPMPFAPGDVLWVRETWGNVGDSENPVWVHRADNDHFVRDDLADGIWHPPQQMARYLSRLILIVGDVQVLRVQDVSEEQAQALGFQRVDEPSIRAEFMFDWCGRYGITQEKPLTWNSNPWCALAEVTVRQSNVDAMEAAE